MKLNLTAVYAHEAQMLRILKEWGTQIDVYTDRLPYSKKPFIDPPSAQLWVSETSGVAYRCKTWSDLLSALEAGFENCIIDSYILSDDDIKNKCNEDYIEYQCEYCDGLHRLKADYVGALRCKTCGGTLKQIK